MNSIVTYLQGKKTYIVVAVGVAVGVAQHYGFKIPIDVDVILGFLGLAAHRASVANASAQAAADVQVLVKAITDELNNVPEAVTPESPAK